MKSKYFCLILGLILSVSLAGTSWAVPSLGVATNGIYYYTTDGFEDYQDYFASGSAPASANGGYEGFAIGPSGSDLIIFTNILYHNIYLLTDADMYSAISPKFGGVDFGILYDTGQADGYKPLPYYGINLGPVDTVDTSVWTELPASPFEPGPFYSYAAPLEYSGILPVGSYFFAAADENDNGLHFKNPDPSSPQTTSATGAPIPEPSTLLLIATGLGSIGVYSLRKRDKI